MTTGLAVIFFFSFVAQSAADLLPIVDPTTNCSGRGVYSSGRCVCEAFYSGRTCQYQVLEKHCLAGYDCYDCQAYQCPSYAPLGAEMKTVWACDSTSTTYDADEHKNLTVTLQTNCRNVTSFCYEVYDCGCPSGIAYIGSGCFKDDLVHNFKFFLLVMAVLTVFSTLFEVGIHALEHHLEHKNQKAVLSLIQTFKSEVTLIGIIGLSLYLVSSSEAFEHGIHELGGKEEIIEGIHFLIFFLVFGYIFTVAICFIFSKLFTGRRLRNLEEIFQVAREAAFRGENYEEVKQGLIVQKKMTGYFGRARYRQYNAYRIYFMNNMKKDHTKEELMFFRYDEYLKLCVNDLIGKISGGTWLAWIFFAWNFFAVVYLQGPVSYLAKALVYAMMSIVSVLNIGARSYIFDQLKKEKEKEPKKEVNVVEQELMPLVSDHGPNPPKSSSFTAPVIIVNQAMIWLGMTHVFTEFLAIGAAGTNLYFILFGLFFIFIVYGLSLFQSLDTMAGAIYNGTKINKMFVKEVMKRHPQVDKQVLIDEYRSKNNGELPVINDIFVE